jgi:hypothetical protein
LIQLLEQEILQFLLYVWNRREEYGIQLVYLQSGHQLQIVQNLEVIRGRLVLMADPEMVVVLQVTHIEVVRDDGGLRGVGAKKRVGVSASFAIAALTQAPTERLLCARGARAHSRCSRC